MSKLNNDTYKSLLKSVKTDFDKDLIWNEIDDQMMEFDKKRKRKGLFWWFSFGVFLVLLSTFVLYSWGNEDQEQPLAQKEHVNTLGETPNDQIGQNTIVEEKELINDSSPVENVTKTNSNAIANNTIITHPISTDINNYNESSSKQSVNQVSLNDVTEISENEVNNVVDIIDNDENQFNNINEVASSFLPHSALSMYDEAEVQIVSSLADKEAQDSELVFGEIAKSVPNQSLLINGHFGLLNSNKTFDNREDEEFINTVNGSNNALYNWGVSTAYQIELNNGFSLVTGLEYNLMTELFRGQEVSATQESISSDSAQFFQFENGVVAYYAGDINETKYDFRRVQHFNKMHSLGLSLSLRYQYDFKNWNVFISEGLAYDYNILISGKNWGENARILNMDNQSISHSGNLVNVFQLGVERRLSDRIYLSTAFQNRWDLLSRFRFQGVDHRYQSFNAQIGLRYALNNAR